MMSHLGKFSLKDKVIVICGGTGLIGEAVVRHIAGCRAMTIILDIDRTKGKTLAQDIVNGGGQAKYEYFDVTEVSTYPKKLEDLRKIYGSLDGWVNLAYPRTKDWIKPLEQLTWDSLNKNTQMQLNTCAWLSLKVALLMKKNKIQGSIINFGSTYGIKANDFTIYEGTSLSSPMAYSMIKAGVIGVSRYLASYFGKNKIRVNSISPGGVFNHQAPKFVKNYDLVIFSGNNCLTAARNARPGVKKVFYCHSPVRHAFDLRLYYLSRMSWWKRPIFLIVTWFSRLVYQWGFKQMDVIIANSKNVQSRISRRHSSSEKDQ